LANSRSAQLEEGGEGCGGNGGDTDETGDADYRYAAYHDSRLKRKTPESSNRYRRFISYISIRNTWGMKTEN